jgi:hypothetical protein
MISWLTLTNESKLIVVATATAAGSSRLCPWFVVQLLVWHSKLVLSKLIDASIRGSLGGRNIVQRTSTAICRVNEHLACPASIDWFETRTSDRNFSPFNLSL